MSIFSRKQKLVQVETNPLDLPGAFPDQEFRDWAKSMSPATQDTWWMDRHDLQLFFFYGDLMHKRNTLPLLKDNVTKLATAYTEKNFTVFKKKLGKETFPIALETKFESVPQLFVRGELVGVCYEAYKELDTNEGNGVEFNRKRVTVQVPYRKVMGGGRVSEGLSCNVRAWMYVASHKYWSDQIDGGYNFASVRIFSPHTLTGTPKRIGGPNGGWYGDNSYYFFSQEELKNI